MKEKASGLLGGQRICWLSSQRIGNRGKVVFVFIFGNDYPCFRAANGRQGTFSLYLIEQYRVCIIFFKYFYMHHCTRHKIELYESFDIMNWLNEYDNPTGPAQYNLYYVYVRGDVAAAATINKY